MRAIARLQQQQKEKATVNTVKTEESVISEQDRSLGVKPQVHVSGVSDRTIA